MPILFSIVLKVLASEKGDKGKEGREGKGKKETGGDRRGEERKGKRKEKKKRSEKIMCEAKKPHVILVQVRMEVLEKY